MSTAQPPTEPSEPTDPMPESESEAGRVPPIPDEDGPHDVPDDAVIEKTLPTVPVKDVTGT